MKFSSKTEVEHLFKAWLALSIAFSIALFDFGPNFLKGIFISCIVVGTGFLLHELAHKLLAQKYGCFAEFRANMNMLIFAILLSFTGIILAAPGAVMIKGVVDKRKNGLISAAGPATNFALALIFFILLYFEVFEMISKYGFMINTWIGFFNLIPFGIFDGYKIMKWSKTVYAFMVFIAVSLFLLQSFI